MTTTSPTTVASWPEFQDRWAGATNFLMTGACVPFAFAMPSLDRVVAEMRADEFAAIGSGKPGDRLLKDNQAATFRQLSIEQALDTSFSLAHFKLSRFDAPGKFLHGFNDQVLTPWQQALTAHGFTWTRCYPIIFISGKHCATNYHMDFSHVLAWQIYGVKRFCGLRDPNHWAPKDVRLNYKAGELARPPQLTDQDALCYEMSPGTVLWNALLTPHWVDAGDQVAMSVNLSHGGLRLHGRLCPFEQELEEFRALQPEAAPKPVLGTY